MADKVKAANRRGRLGGMNRNTAIVAGIGAVAAVAAGALFRWRNPGEEETPPAPALRHGGALGAVGSSGSIRPAGRGAMRDPPENWDEVDEAADQSYPASDPPNLAPHVD